MKKITLVMISLLILCGALTSCAVEFSPYEFSQNGMTITLDNSFSKENVKGYTACYHSAKATVYTLQEKIGESANGHSLTEETTLSEYAAMVLESNDREETVVEADGYVYFVFEALQGEISYTYHVCLYEAKDSFWMIQFISESSSYENLKTQIESWADSVAFES